MYLNAFLDQLREWEINPWCNFVHSFICVYRRRAIRYGIFSVVRSKRLKPVIQRLNRSIDVFLLHLWSFQEHVFANREYFMIVIIEIYPEEICTETLQTNSGFFIYHFLFGPQKRYLYRCKTDV